MPYLKTIVCEEEMTDYTLKKNWDSLNTLKNRIEGDKKSKEKVVMFDGIQLVTNKYTYQLFDGKLSTSKAKAKKK